MSGPTPAPPQRRRRRFSLSLRALMLLILVLGGLMGWKARKVSLQRRAVAAIRAAGGSVVYDSQMVGLKYLPYQSVDDRAVLPAASPWGPAWLRRAIGDDYFQEVAGVWLNHGPSPGQPGRGATDDLMRHLADLDQLVVLQIHEAKITDTGMAHLRGLTRLRGLTLHHVTITDAGLEPLRGLTNLEELHVLTYPANITGVGLNHLAGLTRLRVLNLFNTRLDDSSLSSLRQMVRLESLHISGTLITDAGMMHLSTLTSLKYLGFDASRGLTDAGIEDLAKLNKLEGLTMGDSGMTDAGMARLASLTRLGRLNVYGTKQLTGVGASTLGGLTLKYLDIGGCAVDEAGLEQIGRLNSLEDLRLESNPKVDDAGLSHLRALKALTYLGIRQTGVTPEAAIALQEGLPLLRVHIDKFNYPVPNRGATGK